MAPFMNLPDELIVKVIGGLNGSIQDLTKLQLVCRRFYLLVRDRELWRNLCFEGSIAGRRHNRSTIPKIIPPRDVQVLQAEVAAVTTATIEASMQKKAEDAQQTRSSARQRELSKWDPHIDGERTNWYREFIAREAPVNIDWACHGKAATRDVEGVALYEASDDSRQAVARFDDGRVGVWTFDGGEAGQSRSSFVLSSEDVLRSGYTGQYDGMLQDKASLSAITDSIAIDRARQKAYIAVDCQLNEVDLNTFQLASCTAFPRPISALSNMPPGAQLIVGTSSGLYRHDHRAPSRWVDRGQASPSSSESGPGLSLSILQPPLFTSGPSPSSQIYAAGRFPSVLVYEQRSFPDVTQSIWSGANLSSLSVVPHHLPQIPSGTDLLSPHSSSNDTNTLRRQSTHTLLAAGAKNGKGSLELYGISSNNGSGSGPTVYGSIRNRTMASRVKLLSVVPHGRRICTSDADGNIKWFERDGFNLVRQMNVNDLLPRVSPPSSASASSPLSSRSSSASSSGRTPPSRGGLFGSRQDTGDGVQKLLPVDDAENADILVWAGSRVGVLGVGGDRRTYNGEMDADGEDVRALEYEEHMRKLLEAQAMEARRMQDFGM